MIRISKQNALLQIASELDRNFPDLPIREFDDFQLQIIENIAKRRSESSFFEQFDIQLFGRTYQVGYKDSIRIQEIAVARLPSPTLSLSPTPSPVPSPSPTPSPGPSPSPEPQAEEKGEIQKFFDCGGLTFQLSEEILGELLAPQPRPDHDIPFATIQKAVRKRISQIKKEMESGVQTRIILKKCFEKQTKRLLKIIIDYFPKQEANPLVIVTAYRVITSKYMRKKKLTPLMFDALCKQISQV